MQKALLKKQNLTQFVHKLKKHTKTCTQLPEKEATSSDGLTFPLITTKRNLKKSKNQQRKSEKILTFSLSSVSAVPTSVPEQQLNIARVQTIIFWQRTHLRFCSQVTQSVLLLLMKLLHFVTVKIFQLT